MFCECVGAKRQFLVALCIYIGQITVGYTLSWPAVIPRFDDPTWSPFPSHPSIDEYEKTWIVAILYLGGLAGSYVTACLCNIKGRKPCMFLGGIITAIAYFIMAAANTLTKVVIGRLVSGFGIEIIAVTALVYLGEIASTPIRGVYLIASGILTSVGSLMMNFGGTFMSYLTSALLGAWLAIIYTVSIIFLPESPVFYALKDQKDDVESVLKDLGRKEDVEIVLSTQNAFKKTNNFKEWKHLFTHKGNRRALTTSIVLSVAQHSSGILCLTFFATTMFEIAGSYVQPGKATITIATIQFLGGIIASLLIERCGRRNLLLISTAMCCLSLFVLGVYFYLKIINHWTEKNLKWLPLSTLIFFNGGLDTGLGIIPNTFLGEMFEPNVRSKGCAFAITMSWLLGFLISTAFISIIRNLGSHVGFWFFSGICALTYVYTVLYVPETKGKSLEEIRVIMNK